METTTLISVEEYLHTSYPDGDREYVDGVVLERNLGELSHSDWQTSIAVEMRIFYPQFWAGVELRVQVKPTRFRIPDVTVVAGPKPRTEILYDAPHLVVEVLSKDDRFSDLEEKIDDYLAFGIPNVWFLNPRSRQAYICTPGEIREVKGILRTSEPEVVLSLAKLFPN